MMAFHFASLSFSLYFLVLMMSLTWISLACPPCPQMPWVSITATHRSSRCPHSSPPRRCHLVFLCSDLMRFGDLTQELWGIWPSPPDGILLGSVSLQVSPSAMRKLDWSFGNVFFLQLISVVSLAASVFHFLGIPADRTALTVCAKSFSSWLEGNCCSSDYVHSKLHCWSSS